MSDYIVSDSRIIEAIRMVVVADLHNSEFGEGNERLLSMVEEQNPDIIFCVGDFVNNNNEADIQTALDTVEKLCLIAPVYFSLGNHEAQHEENFQINLEAFCETQRTLMRFGRTLCEAKRTSLTLDFRANFAVELLLYSAW